MHRCAPALVATALLLAGTAAIAPGARAEQPVIYKWVDEHGVAHYTTDRERIPAAIRDRVLQGTPSPRGADWLRQDAGATAPVPPAAMPAPPPTASRPTAPREAEDVELPEESDGVHAVEAQPDWSEAPGGEAAWAPGDLGEEGQAPAPSVPAPVESAPATAGRSPAPPPPPPPPPLDAGAVPIAADGAPVPAPTAAAAPPAPAPALAPPEPAAASDTLDETAPVEPPAPAAVAAPAPRHLAPDEQAELAELDRQIAEVEAEIARDEEALMGLISEGEGEATPRQALVDDPRFRDIAQRLPRLQADLERLRERRAQIQPSVSTP